jgi:hypothetical protein
MHMPVLAGGSHLVKTWDFKKGLQGWSTNTYVKTARTTREGLELEVKAPDPFLVSPVMDVPNAPVVAVHLSMRSTADAVGQIYYGKEFSEKDSAKFNIQNDGEWHEYQIYLPSLEKGSRLRIDPSQSSGKITLRSLRIEARTSLPSEPWASPKELRNKRVIASGQFGTSRGERAVTSRFLANHPEFFSSFPYDGYVVPALVPAEAVEKLGLPRQEHFLHTLVWNRVRLPYEVIAPIVKDLKSVQWKQCTDNFLNYSMMDGARGRATPDLAKDEDWEILEQNAGMAARLCREANLKGFWLDTEQYGNYRWRNPSGMPEFDPNRPTGLKFPLGKDTPELLRRRGRQWIRAVQKELPEVKIMVTFAWSPDANEYGPLKGVSPFLDGVLEGMQAPGEIIHGHENTFYYGQGPGTVNASNDNKPEGYPGGRRRYEVASAEMRAWRAFSTNPTKYDKFVKIGMAAWVEDHPWNTTEGWPDGTKASFWSNLPLALAYSEKYVWCWSEHTHYGEKPQESLNPFLASISNQTLNTKKEQVRGLHEEFTTDPLLRGWYFDFDMLAISQKRNEAHEVPLMSEMSVPYRWSKESKSVLVEGVWGRKKSPVSGQQRRRYVHPIQPPSKTRSLRAEFDFHIEEFGESLQNPIVIGLFNSDQPLQKQSFTLQIRSPKLVTFAMSGMEGGWQVQVSPKYTMQIKMPYRILFTFEGNTGRLTASLYERSTKRLVERIQKRVHTSTTNYLWDEIGVAQWDALDSPPPSNNAYRFHLNRVSLQ